MIQILPLPLMNKLKTRLNHIKNSSQFASFMFSGSSTAYNSSKRTGWIKVQPTSISRCNQVSKGSKRISAGKRPYGSTNKAITERPHRLSYYNVAKNQMNAKSH